MKIYLYAIALVACAGFSLCHRPEILANFRRLPNGDESELVSIDLQKRDGTEDIKLLAQLRFHLSANQIYVNGHPIRHNVVSQLRMRVEIVEIERGIRKEPRLAPVTFRVLVLENPLANGDKQITVEEEFIKVEQNEVMQVDIKQIVWNGGNRLPMTSISYEDSNIIRAAREQDHHEFVQDHAFKPRLPNEHGYANIDETRYPDHWRVACWFRRLSFGGKVAVICAGVVTFLSLVLSISICWKRHCTRQRTLHIEAPMDNSVVGMGCDDKDASEKDMKPSKDDKEFHMEFNDCYIDVSDKKKLVEE